MDDPPLRYAVPEGATADDVVAALAAALPVAVDDRRPTRRRTFLDTFDWRVHGRGGVLELEEDDATTRLVWRAPDGDVRAAAPVATPPRFAGDLPNGPLRDQLGPALDVRALLPVARVRTTTTVVRVLDDEEKTVVRVAVDRDVATGPGSGGAPLGSRVRLLPVRGYAGALAAVAKAVTAAGVGLRPAGDDVLHAALAAAGRRAGDYSSKPRVALVPSASAIDAAGAVFGALLAVIDANEEGARTDVDPEFLHDLRVAVRRTRTGIRAFRDVLPPDVVATAADGFRWVQQVTGPVRDLDVHLLDLATARDRLDPAVAADLVPLADHLAERRAAEQRALVRVLRGGRYGELLAWWRGVLAAPRSGGPGPEAGTPIGAVARDRIRRADRRVRRLGRAIEPTTAAEPLHDLRKRGKELRYQLELFAALLPADELAAVVGELKALQDNLGAFHDTYVQEDALRRAAAELVAGGQAGAPAVAAVMATGVLLEDVRRQRAAARAEFAERFAAFDRPRARRRVARLLELR